MILKYCLSSPRIWAVILYVLLFIIIIVSSSQAKTTIDFKEQYQDYLGTTYSYANENLALHPMYSIVDNGNNYTISRMGTTVNIPKRSWIDYNFYPDRIQPIVTIQNFSQINQLVTKVNASAWYLTVPWSASQIKSVTDDLIDMGVFKRTTKVTVLDSNGTEYQVLPKVTSNQIRLWFNPATYSGVIYPLIITENTITVDNATTQGWSTANISLNGSRWTDDGSLAIHLRNDSQLNMSGLVAYWSFDETAGNLIRNVNTESGLINATNQGTWNGNATLNYSTGKIGNAGLFDGTNDYVISDISVIGYNSISFGGWFKLNNISSSGGLLSWRSVNMGLYQSTNTIKCGITNSTTQSPTITLISNTLLQDTFYFAMCTYNGSTTSLYINNIVSSNTGTVTGAINYSAYSTPSTGLWIGKLKGGTESKLNGSIDEVRIWNRALSASEIAVLYNTSMRTKAMPVIMNQTASTGNVINRTRIVYTGQDSLNNASIYARQNGTTAWSLVQANVTSNTWYPISSQFNSMDFGVELNGNGSNTTFFTSLEWDETLAYAPTISSWGNNYTNDNSLSITVPKFTNVQFNVTSDIVANWTWVLGMDTVAGNGTVNGNGTNYFDTMGTYTIWVYGSNAIGNSNTVSWTVNVLGACCFNVDGYVRNTLELPLQNARVDLNSSHNFTAANGYYNFSNITEGNYVILARAIEYRNNTNNTYIDSNIIVNFTMKETKMAIVSAPGFDGYLFVGVITLLFVLKRKQLCT